MTSSEAFRCVQAWLLEKPAVWAEADVASLAAALMVQRPPARAREDALLQAERLHHRLRIAGLRGQLERSYELGERDLALLQMEREIAARLKMMSTVRFCAVWRWSAASRSSRKRTEIFVGGRTDELGLAQRKKARQMLKWSQMLEWSQKKPAAAAQRDDFLQGLPMRAGMASGKACRAGGRGRTLPCGCSDGPAAFHQAASRRRAARGRALAPAPPHRAPRGAAARRGSGSPTPRAMLRCEHGSGGNHERGEPRLCGSSSAGHALPAGRACPALV